MSVLVVAAHPDDEVLGAGGTIARLAAEGEKVTIAILGEGITSRYADRADADRALLGDLQSDAQRAADCLGAAELVTFDLPDNRFDTIAQIDVVKIVEELVARTTPHTIYTHLATDLNVDHGVVHRAVLTATRPMGADAVREIYAFEVPSSSDWAFGQFGPFKPGLFVDISKTLDAKVDAMELYESESRPFPHPRSPETLRALARRWGSTVGLDAVEAFEVVRRIV
ncbi:MAG TPA: PIG-L deacetylase family protein [Gaiellaceae bacterium]|jgi:LmbE family N-acetylglucosaminyl deacetylase